MIKRVILIFGAILLLSKSSFAGGLTAGLAPEYYRQGINCERSGMFFEAKVFYQKALLLDPAISDAGIIRGKIDKINSTLDTRGRNLIQPAQPTSVSPASNYAETNSQNHQETVQIYNRPGPQKTQASVTEGDSSESIIETPEIKTMPQRKATEFLTYYSGSEPFLQNCYTPLCQKIIFNNFGISYAKDAEFPKARGMFEECLKIDSYFKPASFNLSIIDRLEGKGD